MLNIDSIMKVDFLIIGQGVSGTFLSFYLMKAGKTFLVIDDGQPNAASRIASGVINPITGRRIVKTWKIDELMPFAFSSYKKISDFLKIPSCILEGIALNMHTTRQMQQAFDYRLQNEPGDYIRPCIRENNWKQYFNFEFGIGEIHPVFIINLFDLLAHWRRHLIDSNFLLSEHFDSENCLVEEDIIRYKNIEAHKIIYCDGVSAASNPYFKKLPFAYNKGEALVVSIPKLPRDFIYKQGFSMVPWSNEDLFWIGSTYEWDFQNDLPSENFKERVEACLKNNLRLPYKIVAHFSGIRPANTERRPFVGFHPTYKNVGILNGMGTKGCSLAPYFAHQLVQNILTGTSIDKEADINRFTARYFN